LTASSGNYSLLLGLNEPGVLTGEASPNGETIAIFQREASEYGRAVERISGTLGALDETDNANFYNLVTLLPGDTLYAYVEGTSGNLVPTMELRDFGGKPINTANFFGNDKYGSLQHTFDELSSGYSLWVESFKEGEVATVGDYRLVIGVNEPSVLNGKGETTGFKIINEPIDVNIGIKIDQITDIDQQAENFTVVAELDMEWQDSNLAFNPDTCQCSFKAFTQKTFDDFIELAEGNWPDFTFFNQQGNRWTQNRAVVVFPEGSARYFERFTTTFQAPDFKFSQFPFDKQQFYVRLRSLFPEEFYSYQNNQEITGMGDQLGEEEWIVTETETTITYEDNSPQFNFRFEAKRYLTFYITRIFIPLILIIIVAWITFFLKDYGKRVDVTAGNLLLFIAYNFTIANDLPRLGYLTFFDKVLISTFFISVLMVVYNVILKRLEVSDREETAHKIDRYMIWIYPVVYLLAFLILWVSTF
jgi:hypothetical protein